MKDSQNQTPLTEENFAEIIKEKLDMAYKKGYNDACEILSSAFKKNSERLPIPQRYILDDVANTISKCKLKDDVTRDNNETEATN